MTPSGFYMLAHTLEYIHRFMYTQRDYKAHPAGLRYSWVIKCWLQGRVLVSKSLILRGSCSSLGGGGSFEEESLVATMIGHTPSRLSVQRSCAGTLCWLALFLIDF